MVYGKKWLGCPVVVYQKLDSPYVDFAGLFNLAQTYGISSVQLVHMPHTIRKMEYTVSSPVNSATARNVSISVELCKCQ